MDDAYFDVGRMLAETQELARESRYLRTRMITELLAASFAVIFWMSADYKLPRGAIILTLAPNVAAWLYWAALNLTAAVRPFSQRHEIPISWTSDQLAYQYEARARSLRVERRVLAIIDLLVALQFGVIAVVGISTLYYF